jgi:hypothetical protein
MGALPETVRIGKVTVEDEGAVRDIQYFADWPGLLYDAGEVGWMGPAF